MKIAYAQPSYTNRLSIAVFFSELAAHHIHLPINLKEHKNIKAAYFSFG
nr:hypothetical protein [Pedobacter panaciterrae]